MLKWIAKFEETASGILFLSGILVNFYAVVMRYVFNLPPSWSLEIFESLMVWAIFLAFGMALRDNRHIVVDLVYDRFPYAVKRIVNTIANLIGAGYAVFMTVAGIQMIALTYKQQIVTIDVGMPIWILYLVMPIGMALLALYFVLKFYRSLIGDRQEIIGPISHEQYVHEAQQSNMARHSNF